MKNLNWFVVGVLLVVSCEKVLAGSLGVYTAPAEGFDTHTFYYDDGREVVLIDTQFVPGLTQNMLDQINSETKSKITKVVVTHPNPDKFNGLQYLHNKGIASFSSEDVAESMPIVHSYKENFWVNTMKAFAKGEYPVFENVQNTFEGKYVIKLKSGETLTLFQLKNPGISSSQVVVRVDKTGDLIVGDLVHHNAHAWLEGGLVDGKPYADIAAWKAALTELYYISADYPNAKVYGGRGEFVSVSEAVSKQQLYLSKVESIVDAYVLSHADALRQAKDMSKHYDEITALVSREFPEYKYDYMVKYSVYGLLDTRKKFIEEMLVSVAE